MTLFTEILALAQIGDVNKGNRDDNYAHERRRLYLRLANLTTKFNLHMEAGL